MGAAYRLQTIDVVADRGYFKIEDIEACEKTGCVPHVPKPQRGSSVREGLFRKDEFRYDAGLDAYVCPAGIADARSAAAGCAISKGPITATPKACRACPLRARCAHRVVIH